MADDVFGIVGTVQAGVYRVERVVAEGGFAVVYRAHHEAFRAPVALKCLKVPPELTGEHQAEFLEKFRAEGELLFRLSAAIPAVVRPLHVDVLALDGDRFVPFIALEWLDGQTLADVVDARARRGEAPLAIREVVDLLRPVGRALERAHRLATSGGRMSIVHRDVKPENVFVCDVDGERVVKILDFGIAKAKSAATQIAGRQSKQQSQLVAFSPNYAAPEQWLPRRFGQTGPWTDVFGLAVTMLEAMTGRAVLVGDAGAIMTAAIDEQVRPTPRTLGVDVSDAVEAVFAGALAVDPRNRYGDAGAFWDDLEDALAGRPPTGVRRSPVLDADAAPGSIPSLVPAPAPPSLGAVAIPRPPALPELVLEAPSAPETAPAAPRPAPPSARAGRTSTAPLDAEAPRSSPGSAPAPAIPARPSPPGPPPPPVAPVAPVAAVVPVAPVAPVPPVVPVVRGPDEIELVQSLRDMPRTRSSGPPLRAEPWVPPRDVFAVSPRAAPAAWKLAGPMALFVLGAAMNLGTSVYAATTGNLLYFAGIRLTQIGALLSGAGIALGLWVVVESYRSAR